MTQGYIAKGNGQICIPVHPINKSSPSLCYGDLNIFASSTQWKITCNGSYISSLITSHNNTRYIFFTI